MEKEQICFLDKTNEGTTIKEFKEYLSKFNDDDSFSIVVIDTKNRKVAKKKNIFYWKMLQQLFGILKNLKNIKIVDYEGWKGEVMNIADTIMDRKCRCQGCKYNDQTYGKEVWNCTHPVPCEDREVNKYGCKQGSKEIIVCEICDKPVHPLDAHMGKLKGELITAHIDCWNKAGGIRA